MSESREDALRERVVRGSTEGERRAALNALVKLQPAEVVRIGSTTKTLVDLSVYAAFTAGVILPNLLWSWGFFGCVAGGLVLGLWMKWIVRTLT